MFGKGVFWTEFVCYGVRALTESVTGKDLPPVCRPEAPVCTYVYICMSDSINILIMCCT